MLDLSREHPALVAVALFWGFGIGFALVLGEPGAFLVVGLILGNGYRALLASERARAAR